MPAAGSAGSDAAKGMQQVAEAGKQSAGDMAKAMQDAMLRTQNILIRFVETGKLSFKDLTRSISGRYRTDHAENDGEQTVRLDFRRGVGICRRRL